MHNNVHPLSLKENVRRLAHTTMIQGIISTLFVACVTAIAVIAYRHPKGYARLYWFLMPLSTVAFAAAISHNIGFSEAKAALVQFIPHPIDWQRVNGALDGKTVSIDWMVIGQVAVWIYLTLLFYLHRIIGGRGASSTRASR